jgi:hypothetical protein
LVAGLLLAGCAVPPVVSPRPQPMFREPTMSLDAAQAAVAVGRSSRQDVAALLGPAEVLRFDNGYEVWAYRDRRPRKAGAGAELVILFAPSGLVHKVRSRPADAPEQP